MLRRTWMAIPALAAGALLMLLAGAQDTRGAQTSLDDLRQADGMTREEMVNLYASLGSGGFEPPACTVGDEMFDDVPASSQSCPWIEELARRGITGGCTTTSYCPGDSVTRAQMAIFIVRATADEAPRVVGEPGEPPFGNGGEGDCLWQNPPPDTGILAGVNPTSFYKDSDGIVHLAGLPVAFDGPGGDTMCDGADPLDAVIFQLPDGYQPEHLEAFVSGNVNAILNLIVPQGGLEVGPGLTLPGGSVFVLPNLEDGNGTPLDGFTFRAAPAESTLSAPPEPTRVSLQALRDMLD